MHRQRLNELLRRYERAWPTEAATARRFAEFVASRDDCLLRSCGPGHVTASAWIVSADGERALLLHHRKLGRWLQLGGHVDGEPDVERAALREAEEESGMTGFSLERWAGSDVTPLDLDVHTIPARRDEPEHLHWDVRFLLRAQSDQPLVQSDESIDLRWFRADELRTVTDEESVLRLAHKAHQILRRR